MIAVTGILQALEIDQNAANVLFHEAHTAHAFTGEEVTSEKLEAVYHLMKMAPTAMNSQPLRITWVASDLARTRLVAHMFDGNKEKTRRAPMSAILSVDNNWHHRIGLTAPHAAAQQPFFEANPPAREGMAQKSGWMQVGYFVLAARAVGLDVGPMTGFDTAGVDQEFHVASGYRSIAVMNLGHAIPEGIRPRGGRLDYLDAAQTI